MFSVKLLISITTIALFLSCAHLPTTKYEDVSDQEIALLVAKYGNNPEYLKVVKAAAVWGIPMKVYPTPYIPKNARNIIYTDGTCDSNRLGEKFFLCNFLGGGFNTDRESDELVSGQTLNDLDKESQIKKSTIIIFKLATSLDMEIQTISHEIGHSLGLYHSQKPGLMFFEGSISKDSVPSPKEAEILSKLYSDSLIGEDYGLTWMKNGFRVKQPDGVYKLGVVIKI